MQTLYYSQISQSLVMVSELQNEVTYYWNDITSLILSASTYDTVDSGSSDFGVTVGDLKLYAFSGSTLVAQFPSDTTIYYVDNGFPSNGIGSPNSDIIYNTLLYRFDNTYTETGSYNIYDSSSVVYYVSESGNSTEGGLSIISGNTYQLYLISSGSYETSLIIKNTSSGSIIANVSSSNIPISSSFIPLPYCNYEVTFSLELPPL